MSVGREMRGLGPGGGASFDKLRMRHFSLRHGRLCRSRSLLILSLSKDALRLSKLPGGDGTRLHLEGGR